MKMVEVSEDALNTLKRMAEELEKEAARYRWLRGTWGFTIYEDLLGLQTHRLIDKDFDTAIDEAMNG